MANVLSAALAFFDRRLGFITDKRAVIIFFAVQSIHCLVPFRPAGHLNKAEAFGFSGHLIDNKLGANNTAKFAKKFGKFGFKNIIREATNKKLHARSPWGGNKQETFKVSKDMKLQRKISKKENAILF
jgi:hypothetical protein